jgi:UMF1 family MFS transporter
LHRRELRAWALYDWANSALAATVVTAVYPAYYYAVAGEGLPDGVATQRFAVATTISLTLVAVMAPILGAIADVRGARKRLLRVFLGIGVLSTSALYFVGSGDWLLGAILFALANIGASGTLVFYDSLLPHVAAPSEMDRVSTSGYALGYLGGGLLLALNLAWIRFPAAFGLPAGDGLTDAQATLPARLAFVSVAVWWLLFSIPLFRVVKEPRPLATAAGTPTLASAWSSLRASFKELRRYRNAALMLAAFLLYNDGILTIVRMATIYGTEMGLDRGTMIAVILLVNFVGVPFSFLFGALAGRIGAKRSLYIALVAFVGVSLLGYWLSSAREFVILGVLVGMFLGGTQGLSRSLFASMIPKQRSTEFFAFFAVIEKFAGILGPALFVLTSSRNAVLAIAAFFVLGGVLLAFVDVDAGRRAARLSEAPPAESPEAA